MTISQISVFVENKFGRLNEILSFLSKENIRIIAATVADTTEYGILRLITTNQHKAFQLLKAQGVSANLSDVLAVKTDATVPVDRFPAALTSAKLPPAIALYECREVPQGFNARFDCSVLFQSAKILS